MLAMSLVSTVAEPLTANYSPYRLFQSESNRYTECACIDSQVNPSSL